MAEIELKPCPWCGSKWLRVQVLGNRHAWRVECVGYECCVAAGPAASSREDAIEVWNKGPCARRRPETRRESAKKKDDCQ